MEVEKTVSKKNNLNTKMLPPLLMLIAGLIAIIFCLAFRYDIKTTLTIVFFSMLVFAILGTIVKSIADQFNMKIDYDDLLEFDDIKDEE